MHAAYGYRRLQIVLKWSAGKTRRLMAIASIVPLGVKPRSPYANATNSALQKLAEPLVAPAARHNLLKERNLIAAYLHHIWAGDFTYLKFQGKWYYLATIIDLYSRQIVGWALSAHHDTDLVTAALLDALSRLSQHPQTQQTQTHQQPLQPPAIVHEDQGSEYCSERYDIIALSLGIELSFSEKGHPWENGFQESFYRHFKIEIDAKDLDRFADIGQLDEAISRQLQYYNTERIHSSLGMTPAAFAVSGLPPRNSKRQAELYAKAQQKAHAEKHKVQKKIQKAQKVFQQILTGVRDKVFIKMGA